MNNTSIMMVAGEASGDQRGAEVVLALLKKDQHLHFFGIGGHEMRAAGVDTQMDIHELAVMGFIEVIKHLPHLLAVMRRTKKLLLQKKPDILILVDYPGFNLRLAKFAKQQGIPVLFYISPQVWAWRQGRVKKIAQVVDHMAVIFPFEKKFYDAHQVPVTYVGHPLIEKIKTVPTQKEARQHLGITQSLVITLCPGSRYAEFNTLFPIMLESAKLIATQYPQAHFIVAKASTIERHVIVAFITQINLSIQITDNALQAMSAADVIVTASGTATLEAALLNKPMVIAYKVNKVTALIIKHLIKIPYISLANIVAGEGVVCELLQKNATPKKIANEVLRLLNDPVVYQHITQKLMTLKKIFGESLAAEKVAEIALRLLQNNNAIG